MKLNTNNSLIFYFLLFFSFISGFCAIGFEVLYMRLISSYLGNMFYISIAVLFTFFFGIGLGSVYAPKFSKYLGLIEILTGLYAIFFTILILNSSKSFILLSYTITQQFGSLIIIFLTIVLLLTPSLLIGFSVPLYSYYISKWSKNSNSGFEITYIFYNLGAALCVLFIEFFLIRTIGISKSILLLAIINIFNGIVILLLINPLNYIKKNKINFKYYVSNFKKPLTILFIINIITAIFYSLFLKLLNLIYGPLNENFAILLFISFMGIFLATIIVSRVQISYQSILYFTSIITMLVFSLLIYYILIWSSIMTSSIFENTSFTLIKIIYISIYFILFFILFGSFEPLFYRQYSQIPISVILAVSSFAMSIGFLLSVLLFLEYFSIQAIIIILSTILCILYFVQINIYVSFLSILRYLFLVFLFLLTVFILTYNWNEEILHMGFMSYLDEDRFQNSIQNLNNISMYKKFDSSVSIVKYDDSTSHVVIDGYHTLTFSNYSKTKLHESTAGIIAIPFINSNSENNKNNTNNSLTSFVMGLGSGITPGALAEMIDYVRVSENNPAIIQILDQFSHENYQIKNKENIDVEIEDAYITLLKDDTLYDIIVNSVPTPYFYSASKLWSQEVFNISSQRLNEDGIFVFWMDTRIGFDGMVSIKKTANSVFEECLYFIMNSNYYLGVCSNEELNFSYNNSYSDAIEMEFKNNNIDDIDFYLSQRFIDIPFDIASRNNVPLNTQDIPFLEFETSYTGVFNQANYEENFRKLNKILFDNFTYNHLEDRYLLESEIKSKCDLFNATRTYLLELPTICK